MVLTKIMRTKRFIEGLVDPLFKVLSPQIERLTYAKTVDAARRIEMREFERRASREPRKKTKTLGFFSGGASSSRGSGIQSQ